jgi:hypothetical protein
MTVRERREYEKKKKARLAPIPSDDNEKKFWARVFQFVGSDSWAFVALVSKPWHAFYRAQLAEHPVQGFHTLCTHEHHLDLIGLTSRKAAFASPSRVRLAHELGMTMGLEPDGVMRPSHDSWAHVVGKYGSIKSIDAAHKLGMPLEADMCSSAARRGSLPLLTWLRSQGCPWHSADPDLDETVSSIAAEVGHVEMLKYIKQQGELLSEADTVRRGMRHMAVIEYFLSEGMDLQGSDPYGDAIATAAVAASAGDLAALQYARTHSFEWDNEAVSLGAAQGGSVEMLNWLTGTLSIDLSAEQLTAMLLRAGVYNQRAAAAWLLERSAEWPDYLWDADAGKHWPPAFLTWAQSQGCELANMVY